MTGPEHYTQAEAYLAEAEELDGFGPETCVERLRLLQLADVHASLARATAIQSASEQNPRR